MTRQKRGLIYRANDVCHAPVTAMWISNDSHLIYVTAPYDKGCSVAQGTMNVPRRHPRSFRENRLLFLVQFCEIVVLLEALTLYNLNHRLNRDSCVPKKANMNVERILDELRKRRIRPTSLCAPNEPGVYAVFATRESDLDPFPTRPGQIIYLGISKNLARRQLRDHFRSNGTGFSTLRRSLGAILKTRLRLTALPRGKGATPSHYCFQEAGEERLTKWMLQRLQVAVLPCGRDLKKIETKLIPHAEPLLNLTRWPNPYGKQIEELRKRCANEARQTRGRQ